MEQPPIQAVFTALADPTRREVLRRLAEHGPGTATQLAAALPISRQAVAKHLVILGEAGLVTARRAGKERRFELTPEPLDEAIGWMAAIEAKWDERLAALQRYLVAKSQPNK